MFTSRLFFIGIALLAVAVVVGSVARKRTGRAVEVGNPTVAPLIAGALFVAFAAFTSFRGTIVNNLWWVITVVFAATAMGLAWPCSPTASKHEKLAKSLIFLPLAISLVGASVIWRFIYQPRDATVRADRAVQRALGRPRQVEHGQWHPDLHRGWRLRPGLCGPADRHRSGVGPAAAGAGWPCRSPA